MCLVKTNINSSQFNYQPKTGRYNVHGNYGNGTNDETIGLLSGRGRKYRKCINIYISFFYEHNLFSKGKIQNNYSR